MVLNLKKHTLPVEGSVDCKKLKLMVLNVVLFTEPVTEPFVLLNGPVANVCVRLLGRHKNVFARKCCMSKCENIFFTTLWFCLMDR